MTRTRLVTFDVYSALLDFEGSLVPVVRERLPGADAVALVRAWRSKQLEYAQLSNVLPGGRIAFRLCTGRALAHALARARLALGVAESDELVAAWDTLRPWPEADACVAEVKARGLPIALLSNGDEDMLRAAAARFSVPFDHIFSSEEAGVYKPHPAIYALPTKRLGVAPAEILHVAGSGNDVLGARLAGMRTAWSNRAGDVPVDPRGTPHHEMRDLRGLAAVLGEPVPLEKP